MSSPLAREAPFSQTQSDTWATNWQGFCWLQTHFFCESRDRDDSFINIADPWPRLTLKSRAHWVSLTFFPVFIKKSTFCQSGGCNAVVDPLHFYYFKLTDRWASMSVEAIYQKSKLSGVSPVVLSRKTGGGSKTADAFRMAFSWEKSPLHHMLCQSKFCIITSECWWPQKNLKTFQNPHFSQL